MLFIVYEKNERLRARGGLYEKYKCSEVTPSNIQKNKKDSSRKDNTVTGEQLQKAKEIEEQLKTYKAEIKILENNCEIKESGRKIKYENCITGQNGVH